ncbi:amidohydrolase [Albimonas pacifica]|uniref:Aminobenzoyl-glutamate utilization protein B n=1 Tax=Albimonas pacifica TaxID=1114924 RepID=A0A1I3CKN5_9RHOB|nr:amidohydrolase [Albimonas pacifica]SFH74819.1 aminobenzoyl-glutamate utilization protein B [Albimonas pacifica]
MNAHPLWPFVEAARPRFEALSDRVWATPETCYAETASAAAHLEELTAQGFRVQAPVAGIPTAMIGEAGEGGPVIAFLGEFDALAGLSQKADVFRREPLEPGANGHGCGHNLLGSASMLAAVAVKAWLEATGTPGRVRYYGCPAEEGGAAKAFMVRDGAFDDVDVAITWHPGAIPGVLKGGSLANARIDFAFEGRAAHAAGAPHLGRSALDAAELMNIGANFLREHMPDEARIHYAFIDAGGISPNVVQAQAKLRYTVRAGTAPEMTALLERVRKVAAGAAMMTETTVTDRVLSAVSNLIYNQPLGEAMQRNLERLGPPAFTDADRAYAARFQETLGEEDIAAAYRGVGMSETRRMPLADFIVPAEAPATPLGGSTDVADVSWVVPTVQMWGANHAIGTQLHSWQVVAQGKSRPALAGMVHAAAVMAATGADAMRDAELRARAKADLARRVGPRGYVSPLPEDAEPPIAAMA